jgi:hypothetical protein
MPEHHIRRGRLHEGLLELRAHAEEVVTVTVDPDDEECYVVITKVVDIEERVL